MRHRWHRFGGMLATVGLSLGLCGAGLATALAQTAGPDRAVRGADTASADVLPDADPRIFRQFEGAATERTLRVDTGDYAAFLSTYVTDGTDGLTLVRYGEVTEADRRRLRDQIASWEAVDAAALTRDQKFVYFVNLYNAETIELVLEHYPVASIRDIKIEKPDEGVFAQIAEAFELGPWKDKLLTVDGTELSLDDIEHSILRPMGDNRVHYALNCASVSCPSLRSTPWTVETLDSDLDAAAAAYIASDRGVHRSAETEGLLPSKIYSWFQADFGGSEAAVLDHLRRYAPKAKAETLLGPDARITGYRYDWALNDAKPLG